MAPQEGLRERAGKELSSGSGGRPGAGGQGFTSLRWERPEHRRISKASVQLTLQVLEPTALLLCSGLGLCTAVSPCPESAGVS